MPKKDIAIAFNECINAQDLQGLRKLMTSNHKFIDSANNTFEGKEKALETWRGFFSMFPEYKNVFDVVEDKGDKVIMIDHSVCPNNAELEGPAIWTASVADDKISEWRVYDDAPENRKHLGVE